MISLDVQSTVEISHLDTRERQARNRNWWQTWRECYTPDATIEVSWIHGPATEYIDRSIQISKQPGGLPGSHRVGQPAIDVNGDRAVADVPTAIDRPDEVAELYRKFNGWAGIPIG